MWLNSVQTNLQYGKVMTENGLLPAELLFEYGEIKMLNLHNKIAREAERTRKEARGGGSGNRFH
jgi:hypothetical protein